MTDTFDQCNASFLNKSNNFILKIFKYSFKKYTDLNFFSVSSMENMLREKIDIQIGILNVKLSEVKVFF